MKHTDSINNNRSIPGHLLFLLLLLVGLYLTSRHSFLLFHSLAEMFSIVVATSVFMLTWNARRFLNDSFLKVVGIAYGCVAGLDLLHLLAYKGMGVFEGNSADLSTRLWIAARYLESFSLLAAALVFDRKIKDAQVSISFVMVFVFLLSSIFLWDLFPTCLKEETGLTDFKIGSEYLICGILVAAAWLLARKRGRMDGVVFRYIISAVVFTASAEMAFTLYNDVYGLMNILGHYLKLISFYLIYLAVVETGLMQPYRLMFRDLKTREEGFEKMVAVRTRELSEANLELKQEVEERKQVETNLRNMELKYRTVADFTYNWEYWELPDETLAYVSPSCKWITGYDADAFIENPGLLMSIILPEDLGKWRNLKRRLAGKDPVQSIQFRIKRKDGEVRWVDHACRIVESDQKEYLGIRVSNRDITERRKILDELRESEAKLTALINNTDELICSRDRDGALVVWNEAFAESIRKNFGVEPYEGMRTVELIPSEQKEIMKGTRERWKQVFSGKTVKDDFSFRSPTGATSFYEIAWSPIQSGPDIIGAVELVRDVTERKELEAELLDSKQRYKTIADFTYAWEYWKGPEGDLLYVSPSCERISGYTSDEFKADPKLLNNIVQPEDLNNWYAHLHETYSAPGIREIQFRINRKDGKRRWIHHICQPVYDEQDRFLGIRASNRDITLQRRAEINSGQHREELAHVLRIATLGELAASLAHELNQPLTSVLSNAQAALRYLNSNTPNLDEVRAIMTDIVNDDKRAGEIIRRLRTMLKRGDVEFKPLDVNELIREVMALIHSDTIIREITVETDLAVGLPKIHGDLIQLQQVIMNLIRNASDAVQNLDAGRRRVIIKTYRENSESLGVAVKDFGKGFHAAETEKLFDQFYTTKPDGLGMGLAISKSICEAHGGRLWAVPGLDRGATFYLSLPFSQEGFPNGG